uniref:Uncharacterized protein n=1 Tax=Arundo donax TaxID=35708 RepID=A0A0A9HQ62_ARUDO
MDSFSLSLNSVESSFALQMSVSTRDASILVANSSTLSSEELSSSRATLV